VSHSHGDSESDVASTTPLNLDDNSATTTTYRIDNDDDDEEEEDGCISEGTMTGRARDAR